MHKGDNDGKDNYQKTQAGKPWNFDSACVAWKARAVSDQGHCTFLRNQKSWFISICKKRNGIWIGLAHKSWREMFVWAVFKLDRVGVCKRPECESCNTTAKSARPDKCVRLGRQSEENQIYKKLLEFSLPTKAVAGFAKREIEREYLSFWARRCLSSWNRV